MSLPSSVIKVEHGRKKEFMNVSVRLLEKHAEMADNLE